MWKALAWPAFPYFLAFPPRDVAKTQARYSKQSPIVVVVTFWSEKKKSVWAICMINVFGQFTFLEVGLGPGSVELRWSQLEVP